MSIKIESKDGVELRPVIVVFGVGGAGCNAVDNMISSDVEGVNFWIANTDAQCLKHSKAANKIQLGAEITKGLGAGSNPEVGSAAAYESIETIKDVVDGCNMVFITAGMGGGTGTGASPVIAKAIKEKDRNILVVGVVTKPFHFEGARRMKIAELGLEELGKYVDTLIVIHNQNLFKIANEKTTLADAFKRADSVLESGVMGITDLITKPGVINLDFADLYYVMSQMGSAMMGTGEAEGERRALDAAEAAICNPLLDKSSMRGARGVLINITGSKSMTLFEVDEAANRIKEEVDENAIIILGSAFDDNLGDKMRVYIVATGLDNADMKRGDGSSSHINTINIVDNSISDVYQGRKIQNDGNLWQSSIGSTNSKDNRGGRGNTSYGAYGGLEGEFSKNDKFDSSKDKKDDLFSAMRRNKEDVLSRKSNGSSSAAFPTLSSGYGRVVDSKNPSNRDVEFDSIDESDANDLDNVPLSHTFVDSAIKSNKNLVESLKGKEGVPHEQESKNQEYLDIPTFLRKRKKTE